MKRGSSQAVDENAWTEVQQDPAKKAKSDTVVLQIDSTDNLAAQNLSASDQNGHQNGNQNGNQNGHNGDAKNGHTNDEWTLTGHLDEMNDQVNGKNNELEIENPEVVHEEIILMNDEVTVETEDFTDSQDQKEMTDAVPESQVIEEVEEQIKLQLVEENEPEETQEPKTTVAKKGTWDQHTLEVTDLLGHEHKVNAVDLVGNILVSASDDTTVKAWDIESKQLICNLSGHKQAVTAVKVLDLAASKELCEEPGYIAVSGSTDCCAKLWHLPSGKELRSIYTYNAITCIGYIPEDALLVTGTEGGKIELFDVHTGSNLSSERAFELPVQSLKVYGGMIICGDPQCRLQVWTVKDKKLCCRRSSNGMEISRPNLTAIDFYGPENIIAGFYSGSVKKMTWINGSVVKIRSGAKDEVDSLQVVNELMVVATSKAGQSYLNFFNLPTGMYLGSAPGTNKMESVAAVRKDGFWHFATGGEKLQLWQCSPESSKKSESGVLISILPQPECPSEEASDSEDEDLEAPDNKGSSSFLGGCCVM